MRAASRRKAKSSRRWAERCRSAEMRDSVRLMGRWVRLLACLQELKASGAFEAVRLVGQVLGDLVLGLGDELGGGRGGGGAEVGGEVGNGEVGFVADGGDDGKLGGNNRVGDSLGVEGGHVFKRAAAPARTMRSTLKELGSPGRARFAALSSARADSISRGLTRPGRRPGRSGR